MKRPPYESGVIWTAWHVPPAPGFVRFGYIDGRDLWPPQLYGWVKPATYTPTSVSQNALIGRD